MKSGIIKGSNEMAVSKERVKVAPQTLEALAAWILICKMHIEQGRQNERGHRGQTPLEDLQGMADALKELAKAGE